MPDNLHKNINVQRSKRNSNFELLRIISMILIIAHHFVVHGIQQIAISNPSNVSNWLNGSLINQVFGAFLVPGGAVGVGLFFLLAGYFNINSEPKLFKVTKLVTQIYFYSAILLLFYSVVKLTNIYSFTEYVGIKPSQLLLKTFLPFSAQSWWFITSYLIIYVISPSINHILTKLNKNGFLFSIICTGLFWYSTSMLFGFAYTAIQRGIFFYMIGAFLKLYSKDNDSIFLNVLLIILFWSVYTVAEILKWQLPIYYSVSKHYIFLLNFLQIAVLTPVLVVSFFNLFKRIKVYNNVIINFLATSTLGVYLIHDSIIGRNFIWFKLYDPIKAFSSQLFPVYSISIIISVYIVCSLIDFIRIILIEPIYMKYLRIKFKQVKVLFLNKL